MKKNDKTPLTALFVKNVKKLDNGKPADKYSDYGGNGLYLDVRKATRTEGKLWKQRYTFNGKPRETGLGPYPHVSLADAREKARENMVKIKNGIDPVAERKEARKEAEQQFGDTFEDLARKRHSNLKSGWKNPKHADQWINTLTNYAFPFIGKMPPANIEPRHIESVLMQDVDGEKFWYAKPETARRVRQRMEDVLAYAIGYGLIESNPVTRISKILPKQGHKPTPHRSIPYEEVSDAIKTIRNSRCWPNTAHCFEWLVLTAVRSSEARNAVWGEIDFQQGIWTIPEERMKAAKRHRVPLSDRCMQILEQLLEGYEGEIPEPDDFLFGTSPGKSVSEMTLNKVLKENDIDAVTHGFRTSFRVWVQEQTNAPSAVAEACLAHTNPNKVEAVYARSDFLEKRRALMQAWASYLARTEREDKIVDIRQIRI